MKSVSRWLQCSWPLFLLACHGPDPATAESCAARPPAGSRRFHASIAHELIGTYQLIALYTSSPGTPYRVTGRLVLGAADSLLRYYRPRLGGGWVRTGDRPVAGVYMPTDSQYPQDSVEVEGEVLYIGCRLCFDASPDHYRIEWVVDSAFGGTWENLQSGIDRAYDSAGHELPNPGGFFCARRLLPHTTPERPT
jgi:hypothetical protein